MAPISWSTRGTSRGPTGLDERLDPDDVHEILEAMGPMDEMMRGSGAFGPKVEPPPAADEQTRMLAFIGRASV